MTFFEKSPVYTVDYTLTPLSGIGTVRDVHSKLPWTHLRRDFPCEISMHARIETISNIFDNHILPSLNFA